MTHIVKRETQKSKSHKNLVLDAALPSLELQHIWFELKKKGRVTSIALIPLSDDVETLGIAHGLGLMAVREPHDLVWIVNASRGYSREVHPQDVGEMRDEAVRFPYKYINLANLGINQEKQLVTAERILEKLREQNETDGKAIFAVDSILEQTHAITLCRAVDSAILCISINTTSFKSVRRTIEIVGRDKIVGSIVLRSRKP